MSESDREMLRLAAGYFQAIEEQLRPMLEHPDTTEDFRRSAYGNAMEVAANIAMHQRLNIEREGIEPLRVRVMTLTGDMRGENALAWLAGQTPTVDPKLTGLLRAALHYIEHPESVAGKGEFLYELRDAVEAAEGTGR